MVEINSKLKLVEVEKLITLENLKEFEGNDLYCFSADEEGVEYLRDNLEQLKKFISEAAAAKQALVVFLA